MYRILFVCTGNICRSPTAEGIVRQMLEEVGLGDTIVVDSAGTCDGHVGQSPDTRARMAARAHGWNLDTLIARAFEKEDFSDFDLILGMDRGHVRQLRAMAPMDQRGRVRLFLDFSDDHQGQDVPDPYGREAEEYRLALDLIEAGSRALVDKLMTERPDQ